MLEQKDVARAGYHVVFETAGTSSAREIAVAGVTNGGAIGMIGLRDGSSPLPISTIVRRELHLVGLYGYRPDEVREALTVLASGAVKTSFATPFSLDTAPQAFDLASRDPGQMTKAIILI